MDSDLSYVDGSYYLSSLPIDGTVVVATTPPIVGEVEIVTWPGRTKITETIGGRHPGYSRLGDSTVPKQLALTHEGDNGEPDLAIKFEIRDGRPEVVDFHVSAKPHGRGVRTGDVQALNLDTIAVNVFTETGLRFMPNPANPEHELVADDPDESAKRGIWRDVNEARRSTRGQVSREELQRVAEIYRAHVNGKPTEAVQMLTPYSSRRTAARRVQQARRAGLLPKTTRGQRRA